MAYEIEKAKQLVADSGRRLLETGLIARTWGNVSARISNSQFVITPSGRGYESLQPEDIVRVNISDCSYEGDVRPSSEKHLHADIYMNRPDVNFIIHTHQRYASALSVTGLVYNISRMKPAAVPILGEKVPTAQYGISSTNWLANCATRALGAFPECRAMLLRNHGVVCLGRDHTDAFAIAHILEEAARERYNRYVKKLLPRECFHDYTDSDFYTVLHRSSDEEYAEHPGAFSGKGADCVIETATPFLKKISEFGADMRAYIDDMTQIIGPGVRCLKADASERQIAKAMGEGKNGAVLLEGKGALCSGSDESDAEAVCIVLEKNAMAALIGKAGTRIHAVNPLFAMYERRVYVEKYSKLKED